MPSNFSLFFHQSLLTPCSCSLGPAWQPYHPISPTWLPYRPITDHPTLTGQLHLVVITQLIILTTDLQGYINPIVLVAGLQGYINPVVLVVGLQGYINPIVLVAGLQHTSLTERVTGSYHTQNGDNRCVGR